MKIGKIIGFFLIFIAALGFVFLPISFIMFKYMIVVSQTIYFLINFALVSSIFLLFFFGIGFCLSFEAFCCKSCYCECLDFDI